jgi:hypothetical protein
MDRSLARRSWLRRRCGALLLTLAAGGSAAPAPAIPPPPAVPDLEASHDFLLPSELPRGAGRAAAVPGPAPAGGERVVYTSFNGKTYALTRFAGRYVAILLPDSWLAPAALSPALVRRFVDRSDVVYQQLAELVGGEPVGEGLLSIAIVPEGGTCGWGCSQIGAKGVEVEDIPSLNPILWADIAADRGTTVTVHEMTHNFDLYTQYLAYRPMDEHAWTDFANLYYFVYSREGRIEESPAEVARSWLATTAPYFADPTATWETCVRDAGCLERGITPDHAWGGMTFRTALLSGPRAARAFLDYLRAFKAANPPPTTPEAKEELHLAALAAGTGLNLGCYADAWHWPASAALRSRMAALYGTANPYCADADGDGWSPLAGDCDDHRPAVHPGATEVVNGIDDDCDGVVDDVPVRKPAGGNFPPGQTVPVPVDVTGRVGSGEGDDVLVFHLQPGGRVRMDLCSRPDFEGWLFVYGDGDSSPRIQQYVSRATCSTATYDLPAGRFEMHLELNAVSQPGAYELKLYRPDPWPAPPWAETSFTRAAGGAFRLTATTASPGPLPVPPDQVRFWVSGLGPVGAVPYAPAASLLWAPPPDFGSSRSYRAQLLAGGIPLSDFTPPRAFFVPCRPGPTVLCLAGGRFQVEIGWQRADGASGLGQAVPVTADTGTFWFFSPANVEVVVKVLDACGFVKPGFWIFAAGLTDVRTTMTVLDTATGVAKTYANAQGHAFQPLQDTGFFAACGADVPPAPSAAPAARAAAAPPCPPGGATLCLGDGRFRVTASWETSSGAAGTGQALPFAADTGAFWFFAPGNLEVIVKVLDGCAVNHRFWVFAAGLTNVRVSLAVTDATTGATAVYENPQGRAFQPIQDTNALALCPFGATSR